MDSRNRDGILRHVARRALVVGGLAAFAMPSPLAGQGAPQPGDSLPPGVTPAMVAKGKAVFGGEGLCLACHGPDGKGAIGPNLTDKAWLHGAGTYDEIVARVLKGVLADESKSGQIMPPKGGSSIGEEQVKAVAAYVWTLSRRGKGK